MLDIPYLNNPKHQTVGILTDDYLESIQKQIDKMNSCCVTTDISKGFYKSEIQKLERLIAVFKSQTSSSVDRKDFAAFVDEHDKRRGTNFLKTFPEMKDFYDLCKSY